ncbi:MAG: phosphoribosylglycinamide formyltransferase [Lachnospiraceae bacterium]|nr:phosphoribosylglycinamide formyltransferase [Lachnospiraceae bacterium]
MFKIVALVSGGGTNMQAIIDAIKTERITDTAMVGVIASNHEAYALERAHLAGIPTSVVCRKDYESKEERDDALIKAIKGYEPDLIVLAGYLTIIPEKLVTLYPNKIINIHPSLIPSFCGDGFYGLKVHEKVLERGVKVTGATVHFVDTGTDTGPIIMQKAVNILPGDTPEILQRRVMEQAEWRILPEVVDALAHGRVKKNSYGNYYVEEEKEV